MALHNIFQLKAIGYKGKMKKRKKKTTQKCIFILFLLENVYTLFLKIKACCEFTTEFFAHWGVVHTTKPVLLRATSQMFFAAVQFSLL